MTAAVTFAFHAKGEYPDEQQLDQIISQLTDEAPVPP